MYNVCNIVLTFFKKYKVKNMYMYKFYITKKI
jgi:hypothetical protein